MKSPLTAFLAALTVIAGSSAAFAQFMDITSIIAGIGNSEYLEAASDASSASSVRVVRLSSLAGADAAADRLDSVAERKARDIRYLHGNLVVNPIAMIAIRNSGLPLETMVSLSASGDGAVVLYANDL